MMHTCIYRYVTCTYVCVATLKCYKGAIYMLGYMHSYMHTHILQFVYTPSSEYPLKEDPLFARSSSCKSLSFSAISSLISFSVACSLTMALVRIDFARSAVT